MGTAIILSTAYLPPVKYFYYIAKADKVFVEAHENFSKQSYRNRCAIMTANGPINLIVPVVHKSGAKIPIAEAEISYHNAWQKTHWRAITSAYSLSPFFEFYRDDFEPFFMQQHQLLFELNYTILLFILKLLKLKKHISFTSDFLKDYPDAIDLRFAIHPKEKHSRSMPSLHFPGYTQVFSEKMAFAPNLSILDLLFNLGPEAGNYLGKIKS